MTFWLPCIIGALIGSFLGVCIHRLPRNESVVTPPSRCWACGTRLAWYDNLPLLGWLLLRGRCRHCGTRYGAGHLFGEGLIAFATGLVCWWAFARQSDASWLRDAGATPLVCSTLEAITLLALLYYCWVAAVIDARHTIIPDELTKPMQLIAPVLALATPLSLEQGWTPVAWFLGSNIYGVLEPRPWQGVGIAAAIAAIAIVLLLVSLPVARRIYSSPRLHGGPWTDADHRAFAIGVRWFAAVSAGHLLLLLAATALLSAQAAHVVLLLHACQALLGSLVGWWLLYLIGLIATAVCRRNAMGYGDVKFLAPLGAILGPVGVLYAFALAALLASLIGITRRLLGGGREIPFGPYLAVGAVLAAPLGPWFSMLLARLGR